MVMHQYLVRKYSSRRGNARRERLVRLEIKREVEEYQEEDGRLFVSCKIRKTVKGVSLSKINRIERC